MAKLIYSQTDLKQVVTNNKSSLPGSPTVCTTRDVPQVESEYSKGIKINFHNEESYPYTERNSAEYWSAPDFDFSTYVSGFKATVQNALTDTLTRQGSDTAHPERGTTFKEDALEGSLTSEVELTHAANFAAENVRTFINSNLDPIFKEGFFVDGANAMDAAAQLDLANLVPYISRYKLTPKELTYYGVTLNALLESSSGEVIGENLDDQQLF